MAFQPQNIAILQAAAACGFIILDKQEPYFLQMQAAFRDSLKPSPGLEFYLVQDALLSWWNVHRCQVAENQIAPSPTQDPILDDAYDRKYKRIRRFERASRLAFHKVIQLLSAIQTEMRYRLQTFPPQPDAPAADQMPHNLSVLCQTPKVLAGALKTGKTAIVKNTLVRVLQDAVSKLNTESGNLAIESGATPPPTIDFEALKRNFFSALFPPEVN